MLKNVEKMLHNFEILLQTHFKKPHRLLQIHAILMTTGFFIQKPTNCTTFIYNCLIKCHPNKSLHFLTQILTHSLQPNSHTFPSLLKSPLTLHSLQSIHTQIIRRCFNLHNFTNCSLVSSYSCIGLLTNARKVFDEILHPDLATCNSMLNAYCINGEILSALELFRKIPNKDIISWTSVINGLAKNGQFKEAIDMFRKLVSRPNEATLVSVLSACANLDSVSQGKEIHAYIVRHENQNFTAFLATALIDFYGKHGCLDSSNIVFRLCERKEVCTWNALISAFACNGKEVEALQLFDEMPLHPNHITFVALLTACSRANFVELGLSLFDLMCNKYGIVPTMEHYGCVVDVLSRAGQLRVAWEFIERMPIEPDSSVLGAILGACRIHRDVELGAIVGRKLMALEPWHCGRYIVLWNIFAEGERWDEAQDLKVKMGKAGVKKIAGSSWFLHEWIDTSQKEKVEVAEQNIASSETKSLDNFKMTASLPLDSKTPTKVLFSETLVERYKDRVHNGKVYRFTDLHVYKASKYTRLVDAYYQLGFTSTSTLTEID